MICSSFSRTAGLFVTRTHSHGRFLCRNLTASPSLCPNCECDRSVSEYIRLHTRAAAWHATHMNACMPCWLSRGKRLGENVRSDKERAGAAPSKPPAGAGLKPGGGATSSQDVAHRVKGRSDGAGRRKKMKRMSKAEREEWKVLRLKAQEGLALAVFSLPI